MLKKIAIVSIYKENFGGGEARIVFELARQLAARYEVVVVCPGERTELVRDDSGLWLLTVESSGSEEVCFPSLNRETRARVFELLDEFGPDVVHAHDPVMLGMVSLVWARTRGVPFVTTPHFIPDRILEFPSGERAMLLAFKVIQPLVNAYLTTFFEHCDGIIALNRSVVEGTRSFARHAPLFTIPNGRDLEPLRRCGVAATDEKARTLCFIGYLAERKNQLYLLRMLTSLPSNYRLLLIGKSLVPRYERELRDFVSQHGLTNVEFLGSVDYARIPSYLEQTHVLVSASVLEAQSLVVIEALASGTPVVGLANQTVDELVDDAVGRRLPKETPPAVQKICSLRRSEYEEMARQARTRVERMDWEPVVNATLQVYETLISARRQLAAGAASDACGEDRSIGERVNTKLGLSRAAKFFAAATNGICSFLYRTRKPRRKAQSF
jgi:glycosyltransferase involved in cell wall biosynthesis